jgi:hypothetical protein
MITENMAVGNHEYILASVVSGQEKKSQRLTVSSNSLLTTHYSFDKGFKHYRVKAPTALEIKKISEFDTSKIC